MYYKISRWFVKSKVFFLRIVCKSTKEILQKDVQHIASKKGGEILSIFYFEIKISKKKLIFYLIFSPKNSFENTQKLKRLKERKRKNRGIIPKTKKYPQNPSNQGMWFACNKKWGIMVFCKKKPPIMHHSNTHAQDPNEITSQLKKRIESFFSILKREINPKSMTLNKLMLKQLRF